MQVVKRSESKKRKLKQVSIELYAVGEHTMVTKMCYKKGDIVPYHSHPSEQSGYVINGKIALRERDNEHILTAGDSYSIRCNEEHSIEVIESGEVIDVFSPIRKDYL
jgi:quercetin dioxygenase-like cupin family protein